MPPETALPRTGQHADALFDSAATLRLAGCMVREFRPKQVDARSVRLTELAAMVDGARNDINATLEKWGES